MNLRFGESWNIESADGKMMDVGCARWLRLPVQWIPDNETRRAMNRVGEKEHVMSIHVNKFSPVARPVAERVDTWIGNGDNAVSQKEAEEGVASPNIQAQFTKQAMECFAREMNLGAAYSPSTGSNVGISEAVSALDGYQQPTQPGVVDGTSGGEAPSGMAVVAANAKTRPMHELLKSANTSGQSAQMAIQYISLIDNNIDTRDGFVTARELEAYQKRVTPEQFNSVVKLLADCAGLEATVPAGTNHPRPSDAEIDALINSFNSGQYVSTISSIPWGDQAARIVRSVGCGEIAITEDGNDKLSVFKGSPTGRTGAGGVAWTGYLIYHHHPNDAGPSQGDIMAARQFGQNSISMTISFMNGQMVTFDVAQQIQQQKDFEARYGVSV